MAQEAVKAVRQAEADALKQQKDAVSQREAMIAQANADIAEKRKQVEEAAARQAKKALNEADLNNEQSMQAALREAEEEIARMRSQAQSKQSEALKLVIAELV